MLEKNSSNIGAERSSAAYILDAAEHSVCLPYFQHSLLNQENYF